MKISLWKVGVWIAVVAAIVFFVVQPSSHTSKIALQTETISNKCTFDEYPQEDFSVASDSLIITMPIQTPTPCYTVIGEMNVFKNDIVVKLDTQKGDECNSECIGVTVARATVSNLGSGEYTVHVQTPDKEITKSVKVK